MWAAFHCSIVCVCVCVGGGNGIWQVNRGHFLQQGDRGGITHVRKTSIHTRSAPASWWFMKGVSFASVCVCGRFDDVLHPNGQQVTAAIFSLHLSTYVCVSLCVCVWVLHTERTWGAGGTSEGTCRVINQRWRIIAAVCLFWHFTISDRLVTLCAHTRSHTHTVLQSYQ